MMIYNLTYMASGHSRVGARDVNQQALAVTSVVGADLPLVDLWPMFVFTMVQAPEHPQAVIHTVICEVGRISGWHGSQKATKPPQSRLRWYFGP